MGRVGLRGCGGRRADEGPARCVGGWGAGQAGGVQGRRVGCRAGGLAGPAGGMGPVGRERSARARAGWARAWLRGPWAWS